MFDPGDIVEFKSIEAGKFKYHLCVSISGHFLFLNSPKPWRNFPSDFKISSNVLPFLKPTPEGYSIVSCSKVMKKSDHDLKKSRAKKIGQLPINILRDLIPFIENCETIELETKNTIVSELADWL
jgi:hypothetical protein